MRLFLFLFLCVANISLVNAETPEEKGLAIIVEADKKDKNDTSATTKSNYIVHDCLSPHHKKLVQDQDYKPLKPYYV